jgi:hypothetical protein
MVSGIFCENADQTIVDYVNYYYKGQMESQLFTFYVAGTGNNPLQEDLTSARHDLASFQRNFSDYAVRIKQACPTWSADNISSDLNAVDSEMQTCQTLVEPASMYPHYKNAVHSGACGTMIAGMGWFVLFQILVGLIMLPAVSEVATTFFKRWAAWQEQETSRRNQGGEDAMEGGAAVPDQLTGAVDAAQIEAAVVQAPPVLSAQPRAVNAVMIEAGTAAPMLPDQSEAAAVAPVLPEQSEATGALPVDAALTDACSSGGQSLPISNPLDLVTS